ncbi:conserved protein, unknown function [Hepatocystis sp. ex Piliocolobus tephrosceles]|nr:conserved protein, unknown function [Hepatocystis sp. ex Piliocolobus tephrosceles]
MEVNWGSKFLCQLLLKEKCMKEKYVYNLLKNFGDINQIIQHANDQLATLGFIINNELIQGEEYLILNCENFRCLDIDLKEENYLSKIKDEHLFNSNFKKNEISLYILIIDYIIENNENLKIYNDDISYESLCLQLNIKNTNFQKAILNKLIAYNWLEKKDGYLALGYRFYTDLIRYFTLGNLDKCSLCNTEIIVEVKQCTNCSSSYHVHCFNQLAKKLALCFTCKNSLFNN